MPVIIGTSTTGTATLYARKILRTSNGTIWVYLAQGTGVPVLRYSTDDGVNWASSSTPFPESVASTLFSWRFAEDGFVYALYSNGANTVLYVRRGTLNGGHTDISWSAATTIKTATMAESDLAVHTEGGDTMIHVVYGDGGVGTLCEYNRFVWGGALGTAEVLTTWAGTKRPQIDFAHTQADTTAILSSSPDLFIAWYENTSVMSKKGVYSGGSWTLGSTRTITADSAGEVALSSCFDGTVHLMATRSSATARQILLFERNAADTTTTAITNPPLRNGTALCALTIAYTPERDIELFQADSTARVLERVTYDRSADSWGSWTTIDADADDRWPTTKIGYWSGTKTDAVDLIWMDSSGTPDEAMYERYEFAAPPSVAVGWGVIPIGG